MTNKYVTSPCNSHFPHYRCVGEETKYVVKEGAKGTTPHAKKNNETAHTLKHAYKHKPHPHPHSFVDCKHRKVHEDGDKVKKKGKGYGMATDHEENNSMANKHVKSPYTPHHPQNVSIDVETKYVKISKEGAKGTTHARTSVQTRPTPKQP